MNKTGDIDCLLWVQFKNGDREAFASLYHRHILPLIAYGTKICPDREVLKDCIHELFVELWNSRSRLAPTDSVKFYLFSALRYKLIRREKRQRIQSHAILPRTDWLDEEVDNPIEVEIILREDHAYHAALLQKAVKQLTARQQEVIQLRYYQGFTNQQIAELMHMHYQSVSNLLYTALCKLKEAVRLHDVIISIFSCLLFFV